MKHALCVLAAVAALASASCSSSIKSWQRETLAHRCMTDKSRPEEQRARQHMLGARESSAGASGETGGGCGCK